MWSWETNRQASAEVRSGPCWWIIIVKTTITLPFSVDHFYFSIMMPNYPNFGGATIIWENKSGWITKPYWFELFVDAGLKKSYLRCATFICIYTAKLKLNTPTKNYCNQCSYNNILDQRYKSVFVLIFLTISLRKKNYKYKKIAWPSEDFSLSQLDRTVT